MSSVVVYMSKKKAPVKKATVKPAGKKKTQGKKATTKKSQIRPSAKSNAGPTKKKATKKKVSAKKNKVKKTPARIPAKTKEKKTPTRKAYWLTQNQMAAAHGVTRQALISWGVEPIARIGRCAYYLAGDVTVNRVELERAKFKKSPEAAKEVSRVNKERDQKLRLIEAQAEGQELKNAELRQELAPVTLIEWVLGKVGGQISAILDALPLQLKKRNPKLTASNIETIKREIVKTQNAAAQITVDLDEYYDSKDQ